MRQTNRAWLLPYSTLMTLLFTVFLALYVSASRKSAGKNDEVSKSSLAKPPQPSISDAAQSASHAVTQSATTSEGTTVPSDYGVGVTGEGWKETANSIEQIFLTHYGSAELSKVLQIGMRKGTDLVLQVLEEDFFPRNTVEVHPAMRPLLSRIGKQMVQGEHSVVLRVYASDREENPWLLASRRGAWVVDFLQTRVKLPSRRIAVQNHVYASDALHETWDDGRRRALEIDLLR